MRKLIIGFILGFLIAEVLSLGVVKFWVNIYRYDDEPFLEVYYHPPHEWFQDRAWYFWNTNGEHTNT